MNRVTEAIHPVPADFDADIGPAELAALHAAANNDPDAFWLDQARRLDWDRFPKVAGDWSFDKAFEIYVADLSGKILKKLVDSPGYDAEATISPRGDRIVFTSDRDGDLEIYSMKLDGSDLKRLTSEPGYDGGAFYSPDGSRIIYRGSRTEDYRALQVYVMNADGSEKRQLTSGGGTSFAPSWHPDGKRIVYCSNSGAPADNRGDFDLYLLEVDAAGGGGAVKLTDYPGFDGFPVFSPDGRKLVFSSNREGASPYQTSIFIADFVEP